MGRQLCGMISWRTLFAGPANRGRTFFPFPCTDEDSVGGVPTIAYETILNNIATALAGPIAFGAGGMAVLGVYHRVSRTTSPIDDWTIQRKFATQKRRGSYGRANVSPI